MALNTPSSSAESTEPTRRGFHKTVAGTFVAMVGSQVSDVMATDQRGWYSGAGLTPFQLSSGGVVQYLDSSVGGAEEEFQGDVESTELVGTGPEGQAPEANKKNSDPQNTLFFFHGTLGRPEIMRAMHPLFQKTGIRVVSPDLRGRSVMEIARNNVELCHALIGPDAPAYALASSGGLKDATVFCAEHGNVPYLCVASGQPDLEDKRSFGLLHPDKQDSLNALRGVPETALIPFFQPVRNLFARIKKWAAPNRVERLVQSGALSSELLTSSLSPGAQQYLAKHKTFKERLYGDAETYAAWEAIRSLKKLFGWRRHIDWSGLRNMFVDIHHGRKDGIVPFRNAHITESMFKGRVKKVHVEPHDDGNHLLLKMEAEYFAQRIARVMAEIGGSPNIQVTDDMPIVSSGVPPMDDMRVPAGNMPM